MEEILTQSIQLSLANCLTDNAIFLAEQLVAYSRPNQYQLPSEHSLHLLAKCYLEANKDAAAFEVLKGTISEKNRYLLAVTAIRLNRLSEAERALVPIYGIRSPKDYDTVPNGSYGIYLLGVIAKKQGETKKAISHFKKALELNPFIWSAYEALCSLGANVDPSLFFGADESQLAALQAVSKVDASKPAINAPSKSIPPSKTDKKVVAVPDRSTNLRQPVAPVKSKVDERLQDAAKEIISTPALAQRMKMRLSPSAASEIMNHDPKSSFETPQTPATSIYGLATVSSPVLIARKAPQKPFVRESVPFPVQVINFDSTPSRSAQTPSSKSTAVTDDSSKTEQSVKKRNLKATTATSSMASTSTSNSSSRMAPAAKKTVVSTPVTSTAAKPTVQSRVPHARAAKSRATSSLQSINSSHTSSKTPSTVTHTPTVSIEAPKVAQKQHRKATSDDEDDTHPVRPLSFGSSTPNDAPKLLTGKLNFAEPNVKSQAPTISLVEETIQTHSLTDTQDDPNKNEDNSVGTDDTVDYSIGIAELLTLLRQIGVGTRLLHQYLFPAALKSFNALPDSQINSPYVIQHMARCHYELMDHSKARYFYERLRKIAPYHHSGLEYFSALLWRAEDITKLGHLAHEMVTFDPSSAEAWCVVGTCSSVQKDRESAIGFFKRAVQIDPNFSYAFTLAGYEYIDQENWEKALSAYREAVRIEPRSYYGWFGLGTIYLKQDKPKEALSYYSQALRVHPNSHILYYNLGRCYYALNNFGKAVEMYQKAFSLQPLTSSQYQLAGALIASKRKLEAEQVVSNLMKVAPDSGAIRWLHGRLLKLQGDKSRANEEFMLAQELDPKIAPLLKREQDSIEDPEYVPNFYDPPLL